MNLPAYKAYLRRTLPKLDSRKIDNDGARAKWRYVSFFYRGEYLHDKHGLFVTRLDLASVRVQLELGYILREKPTSIHIEIL